MKFFFNVLEFFRLYVFVNISVWLKVLGNYYFILYIKDINFWRLYCDIELKFVGNDCLGVGY